QHHESEQWRRGPAERQVPGRIGIRPQLLRHGMVRCLFLRPLVVRQHSDAGHHLCHHRSLERRHPVITRTNATRWACKSSPLHCHRMMRGMDMKALISVVVLSLGLAATAQAAPISYGDVTGGGTFAGTTTSNSAWASENPVDGNEVNFWTFNGTAGDSLSIVINSLDGVFDAAFSLFYGAIDSMDLMFG